MKANTMATGRDPALDLRPRLLETRTGDVTVHCSDTLHRAFPPVDRPRKVVYSSFGLPPLPGDAIDALNGEASTLAVLAASRGVRRGATRLITSGATGAARVLFGKGRGRLGWGRWIMAVLGGYRGLLAEAKLWERRQLGVPPPA